MIFSLWLSMCRTRDGTNQQTALMITFLRILLESIGSVFCHVVGIDYFLPGLAWCGKRIALLEFLQDENVHHYRRDSCTPLFTYV